MVYPLHIPMSLAQRWLTTTNLGCMTFWCPCILYGRINHRLHNDHNLNGYKKKNDAVRASPYPFPPVF